MLTKNKPRELSIGLIRCIAMCMIILCHFLQYYQNELAFWFNVGVQIFFAVSGFLYGRKQIDDDIGFIAKNFKKILLNYYIFLLAAVPIYIAFARNNIDIKNIPFVLIAYSTIKGIGHLWFIAYILLCYIITPLLSRFSQKICECSNRSFLFVLICVVFVFQIICFTYVNFFIAAWVLCYVLSFLISKRLTDSKLKLKTILMWLIPLCFFAIIYRILFEYFFIFSFTGFKKMIFDTTLQYSQAILGLTLFFSLYAFFSKININKFNFIKKIVSFSDKYSYDIYITHQIFILGPFGIMTLFPNNYLNVFFALILIFLSGYLLNVLGNFVEKFTSRIFKTATD